MDEIAAEAKQLQDNLADYWRQVGEWLIGHFPVGTTVKHIDGAVGIVVGTEYSKSLQEQVLLIQTAVRGRERKVTIGQVANYIKV